MTQTTSANQAPAKNRARATDGWRLEPHVCRSCFSRLVSRQADDEDAGRVYLCTSCGLEGAGHRADVLCACGTKLRKGKVAWVDAGIRCHENLARSPEFPALYVASYGGAQAEEN